MNFRGTFRDGVIVPSEPVILREGASVDCRVVAAATKPKRTAKRKPLRVSPRRMTAEQRVTALMQGFGIMRGAPEWKGKSSAEIAADLRTRALGGRFGG